MKTCSATSPAARPASCPQPAAPKADDGWSISPDAETPAKPGYEVSTDVFTREQRAAIWAGAAPQAPLGPRAAQPQYDPFTLPDVPKRETPINHEWWKKPIAGLTKQVRKDIGKLAKPLSTVTEPFGLDEKKLKEKLQELPEKGVEAGVKAVVKETVVKPAQAAAAVPEGRGNPIEMKETATYQSFPGASVTIPID